MGMAARAGGELGRDLTSQGLDSLMAAQLRQEVQRSHGILLPVGKILSRATLSELTAHLATARGAEREG
ncbi:acyl carrier protein [Streptomyces sp. NBC_01190]|uniref:acyl carrier protein n=1 Tax=Streptomyces sp. NBC_01190 TaxID=2903767 RepID=UPI00386E505B|nr:acyl carrier protein [Streptomyces sp. NBC_01190]